MFTADSDIPPTAVGVLDHGYVLLDGSMAADLDVVNAARVSFNQRQDEMDDRGAGLVSFLMRERHGTPFEHNAFRFVVRAPLFVIREWQRHRIACLAGDTLITCESGRNADGSVRTVYKRSVKEIFHAKHGWPERRAGWQPYQSNVRGLRVLNEETGLYETGQMKEVWESGVKQLYAVTTEGNTVRASAEHPFLTSEGWVKVKDLESGMLLVGSKNVGASSGKQVPPSLRRGIGVWTSMQRPSLIGAGRRCGECLTLFAASDLHLDHIVPVVEDITRALDVRNLIPLCIGCHRTKTSSEQILAQRRQRLGKKEVVLVSKPVVVAEEMTYDIEMHGPWHNYVANGLVVHNSYNEESGRYSKLQPLFYIPRGNVRSQVGKPGAYTFEPMTEREDVIWSAMIQENGMRAWAKYESMLDAGVAKEVARMVLPENTYRTFFFTVNARSLMNFLSLRNSEQAMFEIREYARVVEELFAEKMPITHSAFVANDRVAP